MNRYRVLVEWNVEAESKGQAATFVWDCIDGHIGITNMETVRSIDTQGAPCPPKS